MTAAMILDATKPCAPAEWPPRAQVPEDEVDAVDLDRILQQYSSRRPERQPAGAR
jgi:hypothetical protein